MSARRYLKPPWMQRHVGNRLAPLFRPSIVSKLSVEGRRTGRIQTVPVAVLELEGERYLVSYHVLLRHRPRSISLADHGVFGAQAVAQ
jgi:hypothetical protein